MSECKAVLEQLKIELEGLTGVDSTVYENFYKSTMEYYQKMVVFVEFYKNALMYLAYVPPESLSEEQRINLALALGLAALVGDNIYNFGELLAHPILTSLSTTQYNWMIDLLNAFNSGNIDQYEVLVQQYQQQLLAQSVLADNKELLKKKIAILALMELVFQRPSGDRSVPFHIIAHATKLRVDEVELLVMKALCLNVVKGIIDEVAQVVTFTWVQPRILNFEQVARMRDQLKSWSAMVHKMRNSMEDNTAELFS